MRKYLISYFWMIATRNPLIFASIPIAFVFCVVVIPAFELIGVIPQDLFFVLDFSLFSYLLLMVNLTLTFGPAKEMSGFPLEPSEFGRPVRTFVLVGTPLLVGSASSAVIAFIFTKIVLNRIGYDPPITVITIGAATLFAILHAMLWSSSMSIVVILAAIILFAPIFGRSIIWNVVDFCRSTGTASPMLIAIWVVSSVVVLVSPRKLRRGEVDSTQSPRPRRPFRRKLAQNEQIATCPSRSIPTPFRTSMEADLWSTRRQLSYNSAIIYFFLLAIVLSEAIFKVEKSPSFTNVLLFYNMIAIFVTIYSRGSLKNPSIRSNFFVRPVESARIAFLWAYVSAEALFVSSLVLSLAICCDPSSIVTGRRGYLLELALKVISVPHAQNERVVVASAIFLFAVLFWLVCVDAFIVGLTGSILIVMAYFTWKCPIYLLAFYYLRNASIDHSVGDMILIAVAIAALAKMIVAIATFHRSRARGLISKRMLFLLPLVWAVISAATVALIEASGLLVGDWKSRAVTILAVALSAPLARFAIMPIVLDRIRHR